MSFFARIRKALNAFFVILSGGQPSLEDDGAVATEDPKRLPVTSGESAIPPAASQLLGALQREGRLVDFLMDDITSATDAEIGAAARIVHRGCRKVMDQFFELGPVYPGEEGARVQVEAGFDPRRIEILGGQPNAPLSGILNHGGWCLKSVNMPVITDGFLADVIQKAEIEK